MTALSPSNPLAPSRIPREIPCLINEVQVLIYKVLATLFLNFKLEVVDPNADPQELCIFPVKWKDLQMKVTLTK